MFKYIYLTARPYSRYKSHDVAPSPVPCIIFLLYARYGIFSNLLQYSTDFKPCNFKLLRDQ